MEKIPTSEVMEENLRSLLDLSMKTIEYCKDIIIFCNKPETEFIELVCAQIFAKSLNDLMGINQLVHLGFAVQAASVASSLQEAVGMLFEIPKDNSVANQFWNHTNEKNVRNLVNNKGSTELAHAHGLDDKAKKDLEEFYTFFCQAKHNNPLIIKYYHGGLDGLRSGPNKTAESNYLGYVVIHISINNVIRASQIYCDNFMSEYATSRRKRELQQELLDINRAMLNIPMPKVPAEFSGTTWTDE
jgi:hypothetical protein